MSAKEQRGDRRVSLLARRGRRGGTERVGSRRRASGDFLLHSFVFFSLRSREAADNVSGRRATSAHFVCSPNDFSRAQRLKPRLLERDPTVPKLKEIDLRKPSLSINPARALRCRVAHAQDAEHNLPQPGTLGSRSPSVLVNPKPAAFATARRVALRFYYSPLIKRQC